MFVCSRNEQVYRLLEEKMNKVFNFNIAMKSRRKKSNRNTVLYILYVLKLTYQPKWITAVLMTVTTHLMLWFLLAWRFIRRCIRSHRVNNNNKNTVIIFYLVKSIQEYIRKKRVREWKREINRFECEKNNNKEKDEC